MLAQVSKGGWGTSILDNSQNLSGQCPSQYDVSKSALRWSWNRHFQMSFTTKSFQICARKWSLVLTFVSTLSKMGRVFLRKLVVNSVVISQQYYLCS